MAKDINVDVNCPECAAAGAPSIMTPIPEDHPAMIKGVPATAQVAAELGHESNFHPDKRNERFLKPEYKPSGITSKVVNFNHGKDHN